MKSTQNQTFNYTSGETIELGDRLKLSDIEGRIIAIFQPNTKEAMDYNCSDTGGILISFEDGDLQLWVDIDEDLMFITRGAS